MVQGECCHENFVFIACWRFRFYHLIAIFQIIIFGTACDSAFHSYDLSYSGLDTKADVTCKMNSFGSIATILESIFGLILYYFFMTKEHYITTQPLSEFPQAKKERILQIKSNTLINYIIYLMPVFNMIAILSYSFNFLPDNTDECVTSFDDNFWDDAPDGNFTHACIIHAIDEVKTYNNDCRDGTDDYNSFNCQYTAPGVWVTTMIFLCLSILPHILFAIATNETLQIPNNNSTLQIINQSVQSINDTLRNYKSNFDGEEFIPSQNFIGSKIGYTFREGNQGLGYYSNNISSQSRYPQPIAVPIVEAYDIQQVTLESSQAEIINPSAPPFSINSQL